MLTHSVPAEGAVNVAGVQRSSLPVGTSKKRLGLSLHRPPIKSIANERGNEDLVVVPELSVHDTIRINVPSNSGYI